MTPTTIFLATLVLIFVLGLAIWAWFSMALFEEQMSTLSGFEGMHFEIGPQAAELSAGSRPS